MSKVNRIAMPESPAKGSTIRSRIVLEVAAELVGEDDTSIRLAEVHLGEEHPLRLSASCTVNGMRQVSQRKLDLAIANPSTALMLAYRGHGPFDSPQPCWFRFIPPPSASGARAAICPECRRENSVWRCLDGK
jgi:hypothetical protein